jgi:hypothetical protein
MAQVVRLVSTLRQTKPGDVMLEYWINAILSGPKTHIVNVAGNTLATAWDTTVQRWAEVAVNAAAGAEGGARAGELVPMYKAMFTALPKAARNFVRSFRAEQDVFEMEISGVPMPGTPGASKVEDRAAIRGIKGRIIRVPTRILTATDSFNKTLIGHAQAAAEAYRAGVDRKLTGKALDQFMAGELADLSSMSWHRGLGYAQELTFQAEDKTGLLKKIQNARSWETVGGLKPLAFIVPFTRTPWNIFAMGMRKSPLGAFALAYRVGKEGYRRTWDKAGAMDPYTGRDAVRHSAEQMLAWAIMLALWGMVDDEDERGRPMITGTGEPISGNQGKRQLEQRAAPPLSIRFGDTWVSYGRLEPAAVAIGMTVDLLEEVKAGTATAVSVGKVASLIARQTEEKTFLSGISDLINVAEDPERYAAQWSGRFAASWVPNLIRQPLREGQQYVPESKPLPSDGDDGAVALWLKGVRQQAFPIESFTQRPKVDVWGRPIERNPLQTSWVGRMLEGTLSPAARRVDKATDLDLIVKAWNEANPEGEWWPVTPRPYFVVNKRRVDLTEEQYHAFLLERGRMAVEQLGHLRWDPARPVEEWQLKAIQGALTRATRMAKATVLDRPDMQLDGEQASR